VYPWLWVTIDDVWQRVMKRPFHWADAGGFDIDVTQEVSADGTVTTPPPEIMVDLDHDTIDNAADARQFGQWLIEAAEIMEAGDDPEAVLAAAHRHAADAIRPFMPGLAREFDTEGAALPAVPLECFPWCVDGDGHGDELFADDQSCTTAEHRVTLSQHDDIEMNDGTWQADYAAVSAAAYADGHMAPEIRLGQGEEAPMRLTLEEAAQVAQAIQRTLATVDVATERTVLDEDLGLAVDNDDEIVGLEGDMPIDRYIFNPKQAREFAYAILAHAARVEALDLASTVTP